MADDNKMTVLEMEQIIGDRVRLALRDDRTPEQRQEDNAQSFLVLGMAKQFFNGADITLRTEKLLAQNKALKESRMDRLLGQF